MQPPMVGHGVRCMAGEFSHQPKREILKLIKKSSTWDALVYLPLRRFRFAQKMNHFWFLLHLSTFLRYFYGAAGERNRNMSDSTHKNNN